MWTDNASKIDMLFYKPYADIISETAINTDDEPLTVGIFGLWGAGKSTLLNMIQIQNQRFQFLTLEKYKFSPFPHTNSITKN